tara:strand:+ start:727 stop:1428 length:702 start_codon:yes stop_codon:yes gene_type:complete
MLISAHQPAFMPWLGYLHKIAVCETFVILDDVQFEKNSFINRNYIMSHNGPILLTVPIKLKNHFDNKIYDIEISNDSNWRKKHLNSIYLNYKKSPFFKEHFTFFEDIYNTEWTKLIDINNRILNYLIAIFEIKTKVAFLSDLNVKGSKTELIINICKKLNSNCFIFGMNGREYADIDFAKKNKINFLFQKFDSNSFHHQNLKSDKNLSSIDLIFNLKKSELKKYLFSCGNITN